LGRYGIEDWIVLMMIDYEWLMISKFELFKTDQYISYIIINRRNESEVGLFLDYDFDRSEYWVQSSFSKC